MPPCARPLMSCWRNSVTGAARGRRRFPLRPLVCHSERSEESNRIPATGCRTKAPLDPSLRSEGQTGELYGSLAEARNRRLSRISNEGLGRRRHSYSIAGNVPLCPKAKKDGPERAVLVKGRTSSARLDLSVKPTSSRQRLSFSARPAPVSPDR